MIAAAFYTAKNKSTKPISFGIIWFFLALMPTSSIIPLGEVLNDHRMYFPFVGLVISVSWTVVLVLNQYGKSINKQLIIVPIILLIAAYAYGTYQRNKVWHTPESLWQDVAAKSPLNGRGLMNFGVALMGSQQYAKAEIYFKKAMHITPDYALLYTNMGLVNEKEGQLQLAENYYKAGIKLGGNIPDTYFFYGLFLVHQLRYSEAEPVLLKSVQLSPLYLEPRWQLMNLYNKMTHWNDLIKMANETLQISPGNAAALSYLRWAIQKNKELDLEEKKVDSDPSAEKYLDLSLQIYRSGRYAQSISLARLALKLKPSSAEAYNNIGAARIKLKQYQQADTALRVALKLKPGFMVAKNNLLQAQQGLEDSGIKPAGLTAADFIDISLTCFNEGLFKQCITNCNYALELQPNYPLAYNNICAANNQLHHWDEAIAAAKKGLQLKPDYEVLKNNLAVAEKGKSGYKL
jgi:protein O-mannosyl-transferase